MTLQVEVLAATETGLSIWGGYVHSRLRHLVSLLEELAKVKFMPLHLNMGMAVLHTVQDVAADASEHPEHKQCTGVKACLHTKAS